MDQSYWQKQGSEPLFPELEWSRPQHKKQAGKLLIIGGTSQGFSAPAEAYAEATKAGIGSVRVLLPDSLRKTVGKLFPEAEYAPVTPSGSFGATALADFCDASEWADALLLPGSIGRNSETEALLENFFEKYDGQLTLSGDAADIFCQMPHPIAHRPDTLLVLELAQLQKLGSNLRFPRAFTSAMGLAPLADALHEFTKRFAPYIVVPYENQVVVAVSGQVSTTEAATPSAAKAATWWLQTSAKPFEALTVSAKF